VEHRATLNAHHPGSRALVGHEAWGSNLGGHARGHNLPNNRPRIRAWYLLLFHNVHLAVLLVPTRAVTEWLRQLMPPVAARRDSHLSATTPVSRTLRNLATQPGRSTALEKSCRSRKPWLPWVRRLQTFKARLLFCSAVATPPELHNSPI